MSGVAVRRKHEKPLNASTRARPPMRSITFSRLRHPDIPIFHAPTNLLLSFAVYSVFLGDIIFSTIDYHSSAPSLLPLTQNG